MQLTSLIKALFGGLNLAAGVLEYIGELKGWTGGAKLAGELRDVAARSLTAFRTDPVFQDEIDADQLSHVWDAAGNQLPEGGAGA